MLKTGSFSQTGSAFTLQAAAAFRDAAGDGRNLYALAHATVAFEDGVPDKRTVRVE